MSITVLLVDDHSVVRSGLRTVLDDAELGDGQTLRVVGEAATGEEALTLSSHLEPDVVLCDLRLGAGIDGIQTTAALRALPHPPAVLILTTFDRDAEILGAIEAGAAGYLLKDVAPEAIADGIRRAALVVKSGEAAELTAPADSPDEPTGELGAYLYEPDGAVIRARLIGDLARSLDARMLRHDIAYLTSDTVTASPFATAFRVVEELPTKEADLRAALAKRGIGSLEIKKRGADVDPAALRKRLKPRGPASGTLVLTRIGARHVALLVERVG